MCIMKALGHVVNRKESLIVVYGHIPSFADQPNVI